MPWPPTTAYVADYIPRTTVDTVTPGDANEQGDYSPTTSPTKVIAQRILDAAAASVLAAVETVPAHLADLASAVAAKRAAASILRAVSDHADDITHATALDEQADADLKRLLAAVTGQPQGRMSTAQATRAHHQAIGAALGNVGLLGTPDRSLLSRRTAN